MRYFLLILSFLSISLSVRSQDDNTDGEYVFVSADALIINRQTKEVLSKKTFNDSNISELQGFTYGVAQVFTKAFIANYHSMYINFDYVSSGTLWYNGVEYNCYLSDKGLVFPEQGDESYFIPEVSYQLSIEGTTAFFVTYPAFGGRVNGVSVDVKVSYEMKKVTNKQQL